jgi:peptide/nickel transport system permease protein
LGHHRSAAHQTDTTIALFPLKRFAIFVATLAVASLVVFAVLDLLPGNAAEVMLGESATPEAVQALAKKLGLDRPAPERYARWAAGLLTLDLGNSHSYDTPIAGLIAERLAVTLPLALLAMALTTVIALAAGVYAASRHNRLGDLGVMAASQLGLAVPSFWFGILLVLLFAVTLGWFPAGGFPGWSSEEGGGLWDGLQALILPALALAAVQAAILARFTRSAVLDVLREDFVRTARAKGLSPRGVLWGHVLRNALVPIVTVMGLQFANLVTGTIVIENVFSLPGLGRLVFQAISNRDLPLVQAIVMLLAAAVIVINFVVDLLYAAIDPRLKVHSA